MKENSRRIIVSFFAGIALTLAPAKLAGQVTVQDPGKVVGTGETAWSYLVLEGESYSSKSNESEEVGFGRVDSSGAVTSFLGDPILGPDTTASGKAALFTQTIFSQHVDQATYQVQFARAGTYYLYMRFTMFENGGNETHYLNEDSFFVPPDFNKDPQNDWPLSDAGRNGGYTEGCCGAAGYLFIPEKGGGGIRVDHSLGDEAGRAFWEGNFHWTDLLSSQFLNPEMHGVPSNRFKYVVTEEQVGKTLTWTISYREGGTTIDLFLFSTHPDLMEEYSQEELDALLLKSNEQVTVQDPGDVVGTGETAWSYLLLEGESFSSKSNESEDVGFARVDSSGAVTSFLGNPILGSATTASGKGALFTQTIFSQHVDQATYQVQFARAGTYYLYMRFTMFENGGNETHYLNEDSFFVPPDFNKDPQNDWPLSDAGRNGGYTEGCCGAAGYLFIPEKGGGGIRVDHSLGDEAGRAFWEGNFHWTDLLSSQFLNPEMHGVPSNRFTYVVTEAQLGKPMNWTISYREGGTTIDLFLFSTHADLLEEYSQEELDTLLLGTPTVTVPALAIEVANGKVVLSWPASATGYSLESLTTLSGTPWAPVVTPPVLAGDRYTLTIDVLEGTQYYRLKN